MDIYVEEEEERNVSILGREISNIEPGIVFIILILILILEVTVPGQLKRWLWWIVFPRSPEGEIEFKYKYSLGMSV